MARSTREFEIRVKNAEDVEELWQIMEELRDCQSYLTKLPKYCSAWSESETGNNLSKHFTRKPVELLDGRILHAGVRVWVDGHADIIIRTGDR